MEPAARRHLLEILEAALAAGDPEAAVRRALRVENGRLHVGDRSWALAGAVQVLAVGKAAAAMCVAAVEILGERVGRALAIVPHGGSVADARVEVVHGGHPLPDAGSLDAGARALELAGSATEAQIVLVLLSGGASALMEAPVPGVGLEDLRETVRLLLESGAEIGAVNTVRKHLSRVKGGRLAARAAPARTVCLALSDVPGHDPSVIGSGPATADSTSHADALEVLGEYELLGRVPGSVRAYLEAGRDGRMPETPCAGDPSLDDAVTLVIGDSRLLLEGAAEAARARGYRVVRLGDSLQGDADDTGRMLAEAGVETATAGDLPACLLAAGETTVRVRGDGSGGRNQELALAAALVLDGVPGIWFCSAASDGVDGPTSAAGAIADGTTVSRAIRLELDPRGALADNDSHTVFAALGDLVITGPTGTNLMDVHILLIEGDDDPE